MNAGIDDELWSAVGDPTRRRVIDLLLAGGDGTATSLSEQLPVTRQAVAKHLGELRSAGLVEGERLGRETRYRLTPAPLSDAARWLTDVGAEWDDRLAALRRHLEGPA